jgi:anti-repressor protein
MMDEQMELGDEYRNCQACGDLTPVPELSARELCVGCETDPAVQRRRAEHRTEPAPKGSALELFTFEHTNIRTVPINGVRWAVAADICAALDIKQATRVLENLEAADKMIIRRSDTVITNHGIWDSFAAQVQSVGLVSEDGATELVLESRKPGARRFRRWLTHTVWPSIRDTGSYSVTPALEGPELLARAVLEAQVVIARAEARIAEQEQKILDDSPKVQFYDELMDADGTYSVGAVAKMLGWSQNKLFTEMRRRGVFIGGKHAMRNTPYQKYMHHFDVVPHTFEQKDGTRGTSYTTRVLPSGIAFLSKKLGQPILREIPPDE